MTHQYSQPVDVHDESGIPTLIHWRGRHYRVLEVLSTWHLRDRWWEQGSEARSACASDRFYYRLLCSGDFICDVYYDTVASQWVLDRVHD